jgi:hypothetical protein
MPRINPTRPIANALFKSSMIFEIPEGNAEYDEWARECGYLILAFGQIESLIHSLERHALGDRVSVDPENTSRPRPRLDALIDAAEATGEQIWKDIAQILREVKSLARTRNLIAHSGLSVGSERDSKGKTRLVVGIRSTKNLSSGIRIDFVKLNEYRKQALELHRNLFLVAMPALVQFQLDRCEDTDNEEEDE